MKFAGWFFTALFGLTFVGMFMEAQYQLGLAIACAAFLAAPPAWKLCNHMRSTKGKAPFSPKVYISVSVAIYAIIIGISSQTASQQSEASQVTTPTITLNKKMSEIKDRYNSFMIESGFGQDFRIPEMQYKNGSVNNTASYFWSGLSIGATGVIDKKSDNVINLIINFKPDGSTNSAQNAVIVIGGFIVATNPELQSQQAGKIIGKLITDASNNKGQTVELTNDNYKYSTNLDDDIGLIMTIEHI